jgi:hypothetical protein
MPVIYKISMTSNFKVVKCRLVDKYRVSIIPEAVVEVLMHVVFDSS